METIEVQGKSIEEAVKKGLAQLSLTQDQVEVCVLQEGSSGLLGFGARPARVQLKPRSRLSPRPSPLPVDWTRAEQCFRETLQTFIPKMGLALSGIDIQSREGRLYANIHTPDGGLLIGRDGQTLEALQWLVGLMISKDPATRVSVVLDVDGYRSRADARLAHQARRVAQMVKRTGRPYHLNPMDADQRRVIHHALIGEAEIETVSEGEGARRKVVIRLKPKAR